LDFDEIIGLCFVIYGYSCSYFAKSAAEKCMAIAAQLKGNTFIEMKSDIQILHVLRVRLSLAAEPQVQRSG